jgi:hypothetical protein
MHSPQEKHASFDGVEDFQIVVMMQKLSAVWF